MSDRLEHVYNINSVTKCRERRTSCTSPPEWTTLFRELGDQLDTARTPAAAPGGPSELALTVVAEALAVAVALSETLETNATDHRGVRNSHKRGANVTSPAVYAGIDCRYLDHRTRALRSALHSVDDYIWWGGLSVER